MHQSDLTVEEAAAASPSPSPSPGLWIGLTCAALVVAFGWATAGPLEERIQRGGAGLVPVEAHELTLESEGFGAGPYHPTEESGVTIGYGYDMGSKTSARIRRDLVAVEPAIESDWILRLGDAAGLTGSAADAFVRENGDILIDEAQGRALFDLTYAAETAAARDFAMHPDTYSRLGVAYEPADWDRLDPKIRGIVIDLKFRGDYRPWWPAQAALQRAIAADDPEAVLEQLRRIEIFPEDLETKASARFEARIAWFEQAIGSG